MHCYPDFNLQDFQSSVYQNQQSDPDPYTRLGSISQDRTEQVIESTNNIENFGNTSNQRHSEHSSKPKAKQSQNTTLLIGKQNKTEQSEILAVFQRIHFKIVSSYLTQISSQHRKSSKKMVYFDKCDVFTNLQLQSSFITLQQVINRSQLSFSQKSSLSFFLSNHRQVTLFLQNTLTNGYQQINNEFIYLAYDLVQQLKGFLQKQQDESLEDTSSSMNSEVIIGKDRKEVRGSTEEEKSMKKHLETSEFLQRIFYQKRIKYLNCQQVTTPVSDQRIKQAFIRFGRLYCHLLIKLIVIDKWSQQPPNRPQPQKPSKIKKKPSLSSQQIRATTTKQQLDEKRQRNPCEILGNWFLSNSCAKSFNSINSLGSINLNNLNDIKIYNSKPDLWSEGEEGNCNDFSDDQLEAKKKRRY